MNARSKSTAMRGLGVALLGSAALLAVLPVLTQCTAQLTLANGNAVPMKCHWTAMAAIATAIPLGLVGMSAIVSRRKETLRALALVAGALGVMAIVLPFALIGVCANPDHACNYAMRPAMALIGVLTVACATAMLALTRGDWTEIGASGGSGQAGLPA